MGSSAQETGPQPQPRSHRRSYRECQDDIDVELSRFEAAAKKKEQLFTGPIQHEEAGRGSVSGDDHSERAILEPEGAVK